MSNEMRRSALPTSSVCRHSPLLASQSVTILTKDTDASRAESWKKTSVSTSSVRSLSVDRHSPLLASQTLTVLSHDADASRAESWEKATELTHSLWPLS